MSFIILCNTPTQDLTLCPRIDEAIYRQQVVTQIQSALESSVTTAVYTRLQQDQTHNFVIGPGMTPSDWTLIAASLTALLISAHGYKKIMSFFRNIR
jgi:hypothetical protein